MIKKKVTAVIEASSTGFGVYADCLPGITGFGKTVQTAKEDFLTAIDETRGSYGSNTPNFLKDNFKIEYKYDISSFFCINHPRIFKRFCIIDFL